MGAQGATQVHVAIVDPCEVFVQGLTGVLGDAGMAVDDPADLNRWVTTSGRRGVLIGAVSASDLERVARLRSLTGDAAIVGIVNSTSPLVSAAALASGADAALARDSCPGRYVAVVAAAVEGYSLLPSAVVRNLGPLLAEAGRPDLSDDEATIVQSLVRGETVSTLAARLNYSDRQTSRRMEDLRARIGARNRAGAIATAATWGFVPDGARERDVRSSTE